MSSYPSYSQPPQGRPLGSGLAIASLVLGILAVVTFWTYVGGILLGLIAIVLGVIALGRVRRGRAAGRGMAIAGVVLGTLGLLFSAALIGLTAWVFNSSGASNLTECLADAGNDQDKIEKCQDDFRRDLGG